MTWMHSCSTFRDIGCRFYTYISTMGLCLEAAGKAGKPVHCSGPGESGLRGLRGSGLEGTAQFVAWHEIPLRHGMTVGELARLFNAERSFGAGLTRFRSGVGARAVVRQTGLPWVNPPEHAVSRRRRCIRAWGCQQEFHARYPWVAGRPRPSELLGAPISMDRSWPRK